MRIGLDAGPEFVAPRRFELKIEPGDLVHVSPKTFQSKIVGKGGIHYEGEQPNARWITVLRSDKACCSI